MSLKIAKAGILDTVQDLGRPGYRSQGVNTGGAADRTAVRILNTLLGNPETAAVIESHFPGPELEFRKRTRFAIGGADLGATIDGQPVPMWRVSETNEGSVLRFARRKTGARAYLAIGGGIDCPKWLGSASTNLFAHAGGNDGRRLAAGDILENGRDTSDAGEIVAGPGIVPRYCEDVVLRVIEGPEHHLLTAMSENDLFTGEFRVGRESDRMGMRLSGPEIRTIADAGMVSCAVTPGVIQLPPKGGPVILLADCQTTGGYPRILTVISADLPLAAQLVPGNKVRFRSVSMEEALTHRRRFERDLSFLRMGIRFRPR